MDSFCAGPAIIVADHQLPLGSRSSPAREAALIAVNKIRVRYLAEQGNSAARAVDRVLSQHEKFFATILLSQNAFTIFATAIGYGVGRRDAQSLRVRGVDLLRR